jgi:hypothetical protein
VIALLDVLIGLAALVCTDVPAVVAVVAVFGVLTIVLLFE